MIDEIKAELTPEQIQQAREEWASRPTAIFTDAAMSRTRVVALPSDDAMPPWARELLVGERQALLMRLGQIEDALGMPRSVTPKRQRQTFREFVYRLVGAGKGDWITSVLFSPRSSGGFDVTAEIDHGGKARALFGVAPSFEVIPPDSPGK